jgi:signal recognition particle GTPase
VRGFCGFHTKQKSNLNPIKHLKSTQSPESTQSTELTVSTTTKPTESRESKMVLAELGEKIKKALDEMGRSTVIDDEVLGKMLNAIAIALIQSDVDIHLVKKLQDNIKKQINIEEIAAGVNKRRIIDTVSPSCSLVVC